MTKRGIWFVGVGLVALMIFLPSFSRMQDIKKKNKDLEQQIQQLKKRNKQFVEEKRLLEEDPIYLEKFAREKMGIVRKGEVIYRITPIDSEAP